MNKKVKPLQTQFFFLYMMRNISHKYISFVYIVNIKVRILSLCANMKIVFVNIWLFCSDVRFYSKLIWSFCYMIMSNNIINFCALNVNGMQMKDKQRRLLQWIKNFNKSPAIIGIPIPWSFKKVFTFLKKLFFVVLQFVTYKQTRVNIVSFIFIFSKIILPSVSINWLIIS
jgi:hypothetical protein